MSEQLADERASAAQPVAGQVGGQAVMLIPHRISGVEGAMLPPDYQRILAAVRQAAGPVMARQVGEMLGVDVSVRGKLEPLRSKPRTPGSPGSRRAGPIPEVAHGLGTGKHTG